MAFIERDRETDRQTDRDREQHSMKTYELKLNFA